MKSKFGAGIAEAAIALAVILTVSMGGITVIGAGATSNAKTEEYQYMRIAMSNAFEYHKYAHYSHNVTDKMDLIYKQGAPMNKDGKYTYSPSGSGLFLYGNYYTLVVNVPLHTSGAEHTFEATLTDRKSGKIVLRYDDYVRLEGL